MRELIFFLATAAMAQTTVTPRMLGFNPHVNLINSKEDLALHVDSVMWWDVQMAWFDTDKGCIIDSFTAAGVVTVTNCVQKASKVPSPADVCNASLPSAITIVWGPAASTQPYTVSKMNLNSGGCPGSAVLTFQITPAPPRGACAPGSGCGGFHTNYHFVNWERNLRTAYSKWGVTSSVMKMAATPLWCNSRADSHYSCGDIDSGNATWKNYIAAAMNQTMQLGSKTVPFWQLIGAYQCWNEMPSESPAKAVKGWFDTLPHLVRMCADLKSTAHGIDPKALIGTPSVSTTGRVNANFASCNQPNAEAKNACAMNVYLGTAGAVAAADYVAIHGQLTGAGPRQQLPEEQTLWTQIRSQSHFPRGMPIWDAEYSAASKGIGGGLAEAGAANYNDYFKLLAGYYARMTLIRISAGLAANYWFQLQRYPASGEVNSPPVNADGTLNSLGTAIGIFRDWVLNAQVGPCSGRSARGGSVWTCAVTKPGGYSAVIAWFVDNGSPGNCSISYSVCPVLNGWKIPASPVKTRSRDLFGSNQALAAGATATLTAAPQIFEAGASGS